MITSLVVGGAGALGFIVGACVGLILAYWFYHVQMHLLAEAKKFNDLKLRRAQAEATRLADEKRGRIAALDLPRNGREKAAVEQTFEESLGSIFPPEVVNGLTRPEGAVK